MRWSWEAQEWFNEMSHGVRNPLLRAAGFDDFHSARLLPGQLKKSFANALVKGDRFHVQPVDLAVSTPAPQANRDGNIEDNSHVRREPRRRQSIESAEGLNVESPSIALVGQG
jgi:hypothetical protein